MSARATTSSFRRLVAGMVRSLWDPMAISVLSRRYAVEDHAQHAAGLLVDVGAGNQPYREIVGSRAERYIALDIAVPAAPGKTPPDVVGDATALPIGSDRADTILCASVLMYVDRPDRAFTEFARVLHTGGKLILVGQQIRGQGPESSDRWRFSRRGLFLLATEAGLEVIGIEPCNGIFGTIGHAWSIWLCETIGTLRWFPSVVARGLSALTLVPSWALDRTGWGRRQTMYWLLVARKP